MSSELKGLLTAKDFTDLFGNITVHGIYKIISKLNIDTISTTSGRKFIPPLAVRTFLLKKGFTYKQQYITFYMIKGGVGKTTLSSSLGLRASHYGAKVLLIDFDLQANLTRSFKITARECPVWIDIIKNSVPVKDCIIHISENLDIIPSNLNNSRLDIEMSVSSTNLRDVIRDKLTPIATNYDLIIFDCPPAINKITAAATCASDKVIVPVNPDPYAMDGLEMTMAELNRLREAFKLNVDHLLVWNKYDARKRLGAIYMHDLAKEEKLFNHIMPVVMREDSSYANAIANATSIFDLPRNSNAREDIDQFTREVLGLNSWTNDEELNQDNTIYETA